jgi:hypothetical protein
MLRKLRKRPRSVRPCDYKMKRGGLRQNRQVAGAFGAKDLVSAAVLKSDP